MEACFLLCSVARNVVVSLLLSLSLFLRSFLPPKSPSSDGGYAAAPPRVYEGRVRHVRLRPVLHEFEYPVRYALFDLDNALFPAGRYLSAAKARELAATDGPVWLLTIPESVGYEQNPLSIYYCYDLTKPIGQDGVCGDSCLKMCIAQVTNTPWGERVMFTFLPGYDVVAKPLHVSPFMDMLGNWIMSVDPPGEELRAVISVRHPMLGDYFTASLHCKLTPSPSEPLRFAMFFWLMPHKVALWIYWQAVQLWMKNVKFLDHPRFLNPNYREDALVRDQELGVCCSKRWFMWRDAQWPWA